jgi:flavin reductase (DIM6/NTAB) family NADH-FMN oxidoreductase RutF
MLDPNPTDKVQLFKLAMRRLAATVTVITAGHAKERSGMTASAVTSLSANPPCLVVCVNKSASFHPVITAHDHFCINILGAGHHDISAAFGGGKSAEDRFTLGDWQDRHGIAYLKDAQANIFCRRANVFEHATHAIIVGEVEELFLNGPISPLIYVDGRYTAITEA